MSFRCQQCHKVAHKPNHVVVKTKHVDHTPNLDDATRRGPSKGYGTQIVKEENRCNDCVYVDAVYEKYTVQH